MLKLTQQQPNNQFSHNNPWLHWCARGGCSGRS